MATQKYNPNWADELRNPAASPGAGQWTSDGESGRGKDPYFQPAAAPTNEVQAKKERFVDAHFAETQKVANELGIPVKNILGASAIESTWGTSNGRKVPTYVPDLVGTIHGLRSIISRRNI